MSPNVVIVIVEKLACLVQLQLSRQQHNKIAKKITLESLPSSTPGLKIPWNNQPLRIRISKHLFVNTHLNRNKLENLWIHLHETIWIPPTSYFHWIVPPWGFHVHRISLGRGWWCWVHQIPVRTHARRCYCCVTQSLWNLAWFDWPRQRWFSRYMWRWVYSCEESWKKKLLLLLVYVCRHNYNLQGIELDLFYN